MHIAGFQWRFAIVAVAGLFVGLGAACANERKTLGVGRLLVNDVIGDGSDRWRTGSYVASFLRGTSWEGQAPTAFGELLEYRGWGEIIAPASLSKPATDDRRYAGLLSFGVHSHQSVGAAELRLGADFVLIGPQNGLSTLHGWIHDLVDAADPEPAAATQIGNTVRLKLSAEYGRSFELGDQVRFRPFVDAQVGVETMVRAGGDFIFGGYGQDGLLIRDEVSGFLYEGITQRIQGTSFILGADVAYVDRSILFPEDGAVVPEDTRYRARLGVYHRAGGWGVFYGVTYLSEEFEGQSEGQMVGALRLDLSF